MAGLIRSATPHPRLIIATAALAALTQPRAARAQSASRGPSPSTVGSMTIDPCPVAPTDQFRFLIAAGLGRSLPMARTADGARVTLSQLGVNAVSCAPMRVELQAEVKRLPARGDSTSVVVHFTAPMIAKATFAATNSDRSARKSSRLASASLCVDDVEVAANASRGGAPIDRTILRTWLGDALRNQCFDITSLVYVYLERGGTPAPPR